MAGALYMGARSFKLLAKLLREAQTATNDLPGQLRKMAAFCVIQRVRGDAAFGPLRQLRRAGGLFRRDCSPEPPQVPCSPMRSLFSVRNRDYGCGGWWTLALQLDSVPDSRLEANDVSVS
jgi:hypothetical protein